MSGGYAKPVIKIDFPELSKDPKADPIWVVIKNPKLLPPKMLRPSKEAQAAAVIGEDGKPADPDGTMDGAYAMAGRLVIAWRVYDPATSPEIDLQTGEEVEGTGQQLLPPPSGGNGVTGEQFGELPIVIQRAVLDKITEAVNPPKAQEGETTPRTSSGSPSPSTTEPGAEDQSQPN